MSRQETTRVPNSDRSALVISLIRLARPAQWTKSAFVLLGPFYHLREVPREQWMTTILPAFLTALAFSLASSACYVVNDIADREADRAHPRKRSRPIASGAVSVGLAQIYAVALFLASIMIVVLFIEPVPGRWVGLTLGVYVANVLLYSAFFKHIVIADVMGLSLGFVLRVMAGCAALAIEPSTWLLNVTFFLSMFLAFGKRLGERRTLARAGLQEGEIDHSRTIQHRRVQEGYTDTILQMAVVVTAVITLMAYALYVQDQSEGNVLGFNLLWLTVLPATYGLLRCIVLLERGAYDDPTELAVHDRAFQLAGLTFLGLTLILMIWRVPG